jgi:hypothetical protein
MDVTGLDLGPGTHYDPDVMGGSGKYGNVFPWDKCSWPQ